MSAPTLLGLPDDERCEATFSNAPFNGMARSQCDAEATETVTLESLGGRDRAVRLCRGCAADARRRAS